MGYWKVFGSVDFTKFDQIFNNPLYIYSASWLSFLNFQKTNNGIYEYICTINVQVIQQKIIVDDMLLL